MKIYAIKNNGLVLVALQLTLTNAPTSCKQCGGREIIPPAGMNKLYTCKHCGTMYRVLPQSGGIPG